jgi:predicted Zn-dependent peptidase
VLDENLPAAADLLGDMILHPAFAPADIAREQASSSKRSRWSRTRRTIWCMKSLRSSSGPAPARPADSRHAGDGVVLQSGRAAGLLFADVRGAAAVNRVAGNIDHAKVRALVETTFESVPTTAAPDGTAPPAVKAGVAYRQKEIEQSHLCMGTPAYHQLTPTVMRSTCSTPCSAVP